MKPIVIIVVIVLAVGAAIWLFSGGSGDAKKPSSTSSPVPDIADAIQIELDAKTRATLALRIGSTRNDLKQLLAMDPLDADAAKSELEAYDRLAAEVDGGRRELATRGTPKAQTEAWLAKNQWGEVQELARTLREKAAAPQP